MSKAEKSLRLSNFYASLTPVYLICRLIGVFPLKAYKIRNEIKIELKKTDVIYTLIYSFAYLILSMYAIYSVSIDEINYKVVSKVLVLVEVSVIEVLMFGTLFFCCYYRKLLLDAVNLLSEIDGIFEELKIKIDYQKAKRRNYKIFGVMLSSILIRSLVMGATIQVDPIQQFMLFTGTFVKSLSKYEFIAMLVPIAVRFGKINKLLEQMKKRKADIKQLHVLTRLHFRLGNVARILNASFACQLLCSLGVSVFDVLFQAFYLYTILAKKFHLATGAKIASPIVWLLDESIEIYFLVNACSTTCEIANKSAVLLHQLRNAFNVMQLDLEVRMYSSQMLHQKLEFSALGFFPIDYSLLYSILGAVTTYLVIFIQFDQSKDNQHLALKAKTGVRNASLSLTGL